MLFKAELTKEFTWFVQAKGKVLEQKKVLPAGSIVDVYGFSGQSDVSAHVYGVTYHEDFDSLKPINVLYLKPVR